MRGGLKQRNVVIRSESRARLLWFVGVLAAVFVAWAEADKYFTYGSGADMLTHEVPSYYGIDGLMDSR